MTWWQILIIIGSLATAVVVGSLLGRFLSQKWAFPFSQKNRNETVEETAKQPAGKKTPQETIEKAEMEAEAARKAKEAQDKARLESERLAKERVERLTIKQTEKPAEVPEAGVLAEVSANLKIALAPWTGKPEPFLTTAWDKNNTEISYLPVELQYQLGEIYTDIRLANNIVWLITEVGASGPEFEVSYSRLCSKIAERLTKIVEYSSPTRQIP